MEFRIAVCMQGVEPHSSSQSGHHPTKCLCDHPVCEEHIRSHQENPHTFRHKDFLPANQHLKTSPNAFQGSRAQGEQIRSSIPDPMQ